MVVLMSVVGPNVCGADIRIQYLENFQKKIVSIYQQTFWKDVKHTFEQFDLFKLLYDLF
jgi:hypothetical protein